MNSLEEYLHFSNSNICRSVLVQEMWKDVQSEKVPVEAHEIRMRHPSAVPMFVSPLYVQGYQEISTGQSSEN